MTDVSAPQQSYVDTYSPPQPTTPTSVGSDSLNNSASPSPIVTSPAPNESSSPTSTIDSMSAPQMNATAAPMSPAPAVSPSSSTPSSASSSPSPISQALEDQNIFFLLGVTEASETEREEFLDELQQVIWEDFLENDVELLVTEEEMTQLRQIMDKKELSALDQQEEIVIFLEKLIPDLEEIMLEKALELKADMVKERIGGMKEYYADQSEKMESLNRAESLIEDDQWREAAEVLNSVV